MGRCTASSKPGQWWLTAKDAVSREDTQAGQGRGSPKQEEQKGPRASAALRGEARGSGDRQRAAGVVGPWGRRGAAEQRLATRFPHSQTPGSLIIPARRDHAATPPAAEPGRHGVPIIHLRGGSRRPARPPRPPCPHLLVGCGEVLSDHGTGRLRLTRVRDAAGGRSSEVYPRY